MKSLEPKAPPRGAAVYKTASPMPFWLLFIIVLFAESMGYYIGRNAQPAPEAPAERFGHDTDGGTKEKR
jgi:hypothetical protein